MAKRRNIVPGGYPEINKYISVVLPYIIANAARLLIKQANIDVLVILIQQPLKGRNDLYIQHSDVLVQTKPINKKMELCMYSITKMLQIIYNDILRSKMTVEDFLTFNISIPKYTKSRRGVIRKTPSAKLISIGGGLIKFEVRWDANAEGVSMAPLADVIRIMGIILKPGESLPTDPEQCTITFTSTNAIFNHTFSVSQAGNRFVCFLQYVNISNEANNGPISVLHSCIIGY